MKEDLVARARAGDANAFQTLTAPHRLEIRVHCYRMLGCLQDAEDTLQETLLAAWQGFGGFEARASLRTWLYRIATNRCLNVRRSAARRPAKEWNVPGVDPPEPTRLGEVPWLEPFPDALLDEVATDAALGPEARYARTESISLAFVAALQVLPHRQVAALILCDVLGFEASEVARMLETTIGSVNSALKRARANLREKMPSLERSRSPAASSADEEAMVTQFARAYEAADLDAVVALLTEDVFVAMPPIPFEYVGREACARFCGVLFAAGRRFDLVPTGANGQPAFGAYRRVASGPREGAGVFVLAVRDGRVSAMTRFEPSVLSWFALPSSLPPAPTNAPR